MIAMLKPITPFIEYGLNKDYIAEFLCINKDKPELSCGGKCHLMKQLEKQNKELPKGLKISFEEYPIGFVKIYRKKSNNSFDSLSQQNFGEPQNYSYLFSQTVFHPPAV